MKMEEKKKIIEVSKEVKDEIRSKLKVTMRTVVEALQFNTRLCLEPWWTNV